MAWKSVKKRWNWRLFLEPAEAEFIKEADSATAALEKQKKSNAKKYGPKRKLIVNRAVQRSIVAAGKKAQK